jgi:hypothetical protein
MSPKEQERISKEYMKWHDAQVKERERRKNTPGFFTSHEENDEIEIVCNVCNDGEDEHQNKILLCDGCDIAVVRTIHLVCSFQLCRTYV